MGNRNSEDEKFIKLISRLSIKQKLFAHEKNAEKDENIEKYSRICVFDCRPWKNAMGNKLAGKGCLSTKNYDLNARHFGNIDNIHEMRSSHNNVLNGFLKGESRNSLATWYSHVKKVIDGAIKCSNWLSRGIHVVVNCSDGWDRTPQICSTTKILLSPLHRTFEGFQTLIAYEWIGFGHKFQQRMSYEGFQNVDKSQNSPIFIQFIDVVYQILIQHPDEFEFTEQYLLDLALAYIENRFKEFSFITFLVSYFSCFTVFNSFRT